MFLPHSLFVFFLAISFGKCQFVYNYEENDGGDGSDRSVDQSSYQYNSPSATNDQFQSRRVQNRQADQGEVQNSELQSRKNTRVSDTQTQAPFEYIEESETPRDDPAQRPRKRKYRRISREGTYVAPPQTPRVYSASIFENIGLGQAPNGVYVPQDSFLNVLKNPSFRQSTTSQYFPQNAPTYYQPSVVQGPTFYVEPPSSEDKRVQPNAAIQPSVRYADNSASSMSSENPMNGGNTEMSNRRRTQTGRQRRQRQPNRSNGFSEPAVDIDALRISSDAVRDITLDIPQASQVNQPSTTRIRQRQSAQNHQNSIQVPRTYSPSVFQNVRLGEAPNGVHIPEDSLLNVLRSPTRSEMSTRNTFANSQASSELPNNMEEENNFQPVNYEQPEPSLPDSRTHSRQRSRTNISVRNMQRRTRYQSNEEEELQRTQPDPASSQQQRRQQTPTRNSSENRKRDSNTPAKRLSSSRMENRESSHSSSTQQNYKPAKLAVAALPEDIDDDGIPGEAGVNYPTLHTIPRTSFSCAEQPHKGYYADLETSCQVFHLCQARGVKSSFLCSNGTIFSQEKFSCQWWYKVNCEDSPKYYSMNDELYKTPEKKKSS